jgi:hypothetical protein
MSERFSPKDFAVLFHFLRWKIKNGPPFLGDFLLSFPKKIKSLPEKNWNVHTAHTYP